MKYEVFLVRFASVVVDADNELGAFDEADRIINCGGDLYSESFCVEQKLIGCSGIYEIPDTRVLDIK